MFDSSNTRMHEKGFVGHSAEPVLNCTNVLNLKLINFVYHVLIFPKILSKYCDDLVNSKP